MTRFLKNLRTFAILIFALGARSLMAQDLSLPATGIWNGSNGQTSVIECSNISEESFRLRLVIRNKQGKTLGHRNVTLPALTTMHFPLSAFETEDRSGTYVINSRDHNENDGNRINCYTMIYRWGTSLTDTTLQYAYALPLKSPFRGKISGMLNTVNISGSNEPVENWLTITNSGDSPFSARIRIHRKNGSLEHAGNIRLSGLAPGTRKDILLGSQLGQFAGNYSVHPDDVDAPYGALLKRSGTSTTDTLFSFPLHPQQGTCDPTTVALSTIDSTAEGATNWIELTNPTSLTIPVEVEIRNALGKQRFFRRLSLGPFVSKHFLINEHLPAQRVGSFRVRCAPEAPEEGQFLLQSVFYGHTERWAYASQPPTTIADLNQLVATPLNTYLGAGNWNRMLDHTSSSLSANSFSTITSLYADTGLPVSQLPHSLPKKTSIDIALHQRLGADTLGQAFVGTTEASANEHLHYSSEVLRIFPDKVGGIGAIMNIPGRIIPATIDVDTAIAVSENNRWFQFRNKPLLLIGDSVSQAWMELGSDFQQAFYLDTLAAHGINTFMIWSYIAILDQSDDSRIGYHAPRLWPWVEQSGRSTPPYQFQFVNSSGQAIFNDTYFSRLRHLVQEANKRNIIVLITIHDGWTKDRFEGHPMNFENGGSLMRREEYVQLAQSGSEMPALYNSTWNATQKHQFYLERFCDRLIQATADLPNVSYEMFNEGEWYDSEQLSSFQRHFFRFFQARTERPLIYNNQGDDSIVASKSVDAVSHHNPQWNASTSAFSPYLSYSFRWFDSSPTKPLLFTEPVPEYHGHSSELDAMMRLMWGTVLGGSGFMVPNDSSWIWNLYFLDPIFGRIGHLANFFHQRGVGFSNMRPLEEFTSAGVCLGRPGQEYVVYSEDGGEFSIDLFGLEDQFKLRFYDPRSGLFFPQTQIITGGDLITIAKPTATDWVAWIRKQ